MPIKDIKTEVFRKALVYVYRQWSYYWGMRGIRCTINEGDAFIEFDDIVLYWTKNDNEKFGELRSEFKGKEIALVNSRQNIPILEVFSADLDLHRDAITEQIKKRREPVQGWRLVSHGHFELLSDRGKNILKLIDEFNEEEFYEIRGKIDSSFKMAPSGLVLPSSIIERGDFRKSHHLMFGRKYENLDLFPEAVSARPLLISFREGGLGLKGYPRKVTDCPCHERHKCKEILSRTAML